MPRVLFKHPIFEDADAFRVLSYLLYSAAWQEVPNVLKKGQVKTTLEKLAKDTNLTKKQVRRILKGMQMGTIVALKRAHRNSIITIIEPNICRFNGYKEGHAKGHDLGTERALTDVLYRKKTVNRNKNLSSSGDDVGSGLLFPEEVQRESVTKKAKTPPANSAEQVYLKILNGKFDDFQRFWTRFPRSAAKKEAAKAYVKARELVSGETILTGLERVLPDLERREEKDIPHAASWLNGMRWEDNIRKHQPAAAAPAPDYDYPILGKKKS